LSEIEPEIDFITHYQPHVLIKETNKDSRFHKLPAWSGDQYELTDFELYSTEVLVEFNQKFNATVDYLNGKSLKQIVRQYGQTALGIKRFARDLIIRKSMEDILRNQITYKGKLGLERAASELRIIKKRFKKIPAARKMGNVASRIAEGNWETFGITKWNDLLFYVFKSINVEFGKYNGIEGLDRAITKLKEYYMKNGKKPDYKDKKIKSIFNAAYSGIWKHLGINTWKKLLLRSFREDQIKKWEDLKKKPPKHANKKSFNRALSELREIQRKNRRLPSMNDKGISWIVNTIRRGHWKCFGITTWNEMLNYVFKKINVERNMHVGITGLDRASRKIRDFYKKNRRKPRARELPSIATSISNGNWQKFGISCWNDLLFCIFSDVNQEKGKYLGEEGLINAQIKLKKFQDQKGRIPTAKDMCAIFHAVQRGYWKEHGILLWNDLLQSTFNEVNQMKNQYKGKEGLRRAIVMLNAFEKKNHRRPRAKDKGMPTIINSIYRGYWSAFGIKKWNDLLRIAFK